MNNAFSLNRLLPGETATICALHTRGSMRRRLLDLGLVEHTRIRCIGRSPCGDPSAYLVRGAVIAIRAADAKDILVCRQQEGRHAWD